MRPRRVGMGGQVRPERDGGQLSGGEKELSVRFLLAEKIPRSAGGDRRQNEGGGVMSGRMDQYLWPFYEKDVKEGRVTKEAAEELLQCVWLNMMQSTEAKMSPTAAAST